jgi:Sec-independent protein translocase protein TatA
VRFQSLVIKITFIFLKYILLMPSNCLYYILISLSNFSAGPKELPRMGRALGKLTGRATGFIYRARAQLFDFAEKTELTKVQQELQMTMQQLQAIRNELQGGINILDPGPLTRQVLGGHGGSGGSLRSSIGGLGTSSGNSNNSANLSVQRQQSNNLPFAASGASTMSRTTAAAAANVSLGSFQAPPSLPSPLLQQPQTYSFEVLPISAAAAGLVPDRSHSIPAASEILADALQEEKVAHQALQFFQQQQQQQVAPQQQVVQKTDNESSAASSSDSTSMPSSSNTVKKRKPRGSMKKKQAIE